MTGILEQIHGGIQQVLQNQQVILQAIQSIPAPQAPALQQATTGLGGGLGGGTMGGGLGGGLSLGGPAPAPQQPAPPANVTGDQLMALITPYLDNAAVKDALSAAMKQCGVNALPEAQPAQYPALYAAFQQVIATHGANPAPATSAAII